MDISFIVILGLPVLYLTGSLRKIVLNTGISGLSFVMYFACTAVLSFLPEVRIIQGMQINFSGAFFCVAPAVYMIVKKRYTYRHYLIFVLTSLAAVGIAFFSSSYTLTYLPYIIVFAVVLTAVVCFRAEAPVFAPVMMGAYSVAGGLMHILGGINNLVTLFGGIGQISICLTICLFSAYIVTKPRGKHAPDPLEIQHDKG